MLDLAYAFYSEKQTVENFFNFLVKDLWGAVKYQIECSKKYRYSILIQGVQLYILSQDWFKMLERVAVRPLHDTHLFT